MTAMNDDYLGAWIETMFQSESEPSSETNESTGFNFIEDEETVASGSVDSVPVLYSPFSFVGNTEKLPVLFFWDNEVKNTQEPVYYIQNAPFSLLCRNLSRKGTERPLRVSMKSRWTWTPERHAQFEKAFEEVLAETGRKPTAKQVLMKLLPSMPDLDRGIVSSHLQKHLQKLKRKNCLYNVNTTDNCDVN